MRIAIYDPRPGHEYLTQMFFAPLRQWALKNGHSVWEWTSLSQHSNSVVLTLADHLNLDTVNQLKNNNCKIVGFSVTDSSYVSQSCREAAVLSKIDLMFMLTGIQTKNTGHEFIVDKDFKIKLEERQFLPEEDWAAFNMMRLSGRLKSLPYVHWERQPNVESKPYNLRSQKALIRGGHHMRRFILALKLMEIDRLDPNSGFVTSPYFQDDMNPQFRYCEECRKGWKLHKRSNYLSGIGGDGCTNQHCKVSWGDPDVLGLEKPTVHVDFSDLGAWNNKCPHSFYEAFMKLTPKPRKDDQIELLENLMNARWLKQEDHLKMLARITFTADCKWLFSIYAAQRFWDAAMVGCVNLLPTRTKDQVHFPDMHPGEHYLTFHEDFSLLNAESQIDEKTYNEIAANAKALYDKWMRPAEFSINTNLLKRIFQSIEAIL